jgi:muconolactone delta-isomerase
MKLKILAIEKEIADISSDEARARAYEPHLKAEAFRVWDLYKSGVFREIYFDQHKHTAVIIMECEDVEEAEDHLKTLPLVKEGLIDFDIIALEPYSGFSRLFVKT